MTLLEVTAIDVTRDGKPCCCGRAQRMRIGRADEMVRVDEVAEMESLNDEAFYAVLAGQFVDVAIDRCAECHEAYLKAVGDEATQRRLLALGRQA